jgi:hypothetical protein
MSIARIRNVVPSFPYCLLICVAVICAPGPAFAQTTDSPSDEEAGETRSAFGTSQSPDQASEDQQQPPSSKSVCGVTHLGQCLKDIGHDQAGIWTSPLHIQPKDAFWLVPFATGTGVALHYDAQAQQNLSTRAE